MVMRVVIVGAGETGRELSSRLAAHHQVLLLDQRREAADLVRPAIEPGQVAHDSSVTPGVVSVQGDGTSRLVLQALYDRDLQCALIAVTGSDENNLEAGRVARAIGFDTIIAVQQSRDFFARYAAERIATVDRAQLLADFVEHGLHYKGSSVPSGVGLGKGELVEVTLARNSPAVHRPLKNLAPHQWRVAAVFRGSELIVPTGDTVLEIDDRVLLVGDPKVLPTVTEYLRLGTPQFPRPFGPNVVTLEYAGSGDTISLEAEALACASHAANLVRGIPGAKDSLPTALEEEPLLGVAGCLDIGRATFAIPPFEDPQFSDRLLKQRPGVVVAGVSRRNPLARVLGLSGVDARLCDRLRAPILFARGTHPYRSILLPVSASELNIQAAEVAIDITRQLGATLTAMNVDLPEYISGMSEEAIHGEVVPIRRLCQLYDVPLDYKHAVGNPIHHLLAESTRHQLVVVARRHRRRDSYFDPDVALRLARRAPCSVLVLTVRRGS